MFYSVVCVRVCYIMCCQFIAYCICRVINSPVRYRYLDILIYIFIFRFQMVSVFNHYLFLVPVPSFHPLFIATVSFMWQTHGVKLILPMTRNFDRLFTKGRTFAMTVVVLNKSNVSADKTSPAVIRPIQ